MRAKSLVLPSAFWNLISFSLMGTWLPCGVCDSSVYAYILPEPPLPFLGIPSSPFITNLPAIPVPIPM